MTPTGSSLGALDPARLAALDAAGVHVRGDPPTKEALLHLAMYRERSRDRAVVHLHAMHSVAVSVLADVDPKTFKGTETHEGADWELAIEQSVQFAKGHIRIPGTRELDPITILQVRDANGNIVYPGLDERTGGLSLNHLRAATNTVFVVSGDAKHDVARAVVTSGLCTVIVTDEATATALLEDTP